MAASELYLTTLYNDANLKAYYRAEDVNDSKGSFTLTNNNSVGFSAAKFGNGFDGGSSNSNKYLSSTADFGIASGSVTFNFWLKLNAEIASGNWRLFSKNSVSPNNSYSVRYEYNFGTRRLLFRRVRENVALDDVTYNITLGTASTYMITWRYDGTNLKGYVNGSEVASVASSGNGTGTGSGGFVILGLDASEFTSGIIDDFAIFDRALDPTTEIAKLYDGTLTLRDLGGGSPMFFSAGGIAVG